MTEFVLQSRFEEADVVLMHTWRTIAEEPYDPKRVVKRAFPQQMFAYNFYEQPHHFNDRILDIYNRAIGDVSNSQWYECVSMQ